MSRPADWSPVGYASDPVPGDPTTVSLVGRRYVGTADAIDRAAQNLLRALDDDFSRSEAVGAIRGQAEEVARRISMAEERYRGVGDAMVAYAQVLEKAQQDSAAALSDAASADSTGNTAQWWVSHYERKIANPATPPANLAYIESQLAQWQEQAAAAVTGQRNATAAVATAVRHRDSGAEIAIADIRLVENSGDLNDGFWDNVSQWVDEHSELLDVIGTVLEVITTIVLVAALLIPGLNVLATIALVAITVNLAYQTLKSTAQVLTGNLSVGEAIMNVGFALLNFVGLGVIAKTAIRGGSSAAMTAFRALPGATRGGARSTVRAIVGSTGDNVLAGGTRSAIDGLGLAPKGLLANLMPRLAPPQLAGLDVIANMVGTAGNAMVPGARSALQTAYISAGALNIGTALGEYALSPIAQDARPEPVLPWRLTGDGVPTYGRW